MCAHAFAGAAGHPPSSERRARSGRMQLVEPLVLSLALHGLLAIWASHSYPSLVDRPARGDEVPAEELTFTIVPFRPEPAREEEAEVAALVHETPPTEAPVEPIPVSTAPAVPAPAPLQPEPTPGVASAPALASLSVAEPVLAQASQAQPAVTVAGPPDELALGQAGQDQEEQEMDTAPAAEVGDEHLAQPEPAPSLLAPPPELGTPDGSADREPSAEMAELATAAGTEEGLQPDLQHPDPQDPSVQAPPPLGTSKESSVPAAVLEPVHPAVLGPGRGEAPVTTTLAPPHAPAREPARTREDGTRTVESVMQDPELLAQARRELAEGQRKGLTTVLLASPEDQLEIARFFGEELVLVPRATLDPAAAAPRYYRLDAGSLGVETVASALPLEGPRQYRDLFDYEYARLPAALRELRRCLPSREDVYLFGALLSPAEWALVIARRQEALVRAGRELSEVRQFVLRYARGPRVGFDLRVTEIAFGDGSRFRPADAAQGVR